MSPARHPLVLLVPGDVGGPTGGNVYDRRLREELAAAGVDVRWRPVAGAWPEPDAADAASLADLLTGLDDGTTVLLDGLVGCGVPDVVLRHADRLRLVVLLHLPLALETGTHPGTASRLAAAERRVLEAVDLVVVTSAWTAAQRAGTALRRRPVVAEPGTDPAAPAPSSAGGGGGRLLCLGSVTPRKDQRLLLAALAGLVGADDPPWRLHLVGAHPDPAELQAVLAERAAPGLDGRVEVCGPLTGDALEQRWHRTDLLVVPSRSETFGMVVTEALARGIPVVVTDAGALPATLGRTASGPPGLVVPVGDVTGLRQALRRWLVDPDLRAELARRAQERAGSLPGWDRTAATVLEALPGPVPR